MTRLSDAEEKSSDTLCNALVINQLPEQYGHGKVSRQKRRFRSCVKGFETSMILGEYGIDGKKQ